MSFPSILGWNSFIGQERVKKNLRFVIDKYKQPNPSYRKPLENILICGQPGMGRASLARVTRAALGKFDFGKLDLGMYGPEVTRQMLEGFFESHEVPEILFIDEIHGVHPKLIEMLFEAMDVGGWNGKEVSRFSIIGTTTNERYLSEKLKSRFEIIETFDPYQIRDLIEIVLGAAGYWKINMSTEVADEIARRSRGTPRAALKLLWRLSKYDVEGKIGLQAACAALAEIGVDEHGLTKVDIELLRALVAEKDVRPALLAEYLRIDEATFETLYEPFLLQSGFIVKNLRGFALTTKGRLKACAGAVSIVQFIEGLAKAGEYEEALAGIEAYRLNAPIQVAAIERCIREKRRKDSNPGTSARK